MREPNFFIVGAPKCGTTSLALWLSEHPQVFMAPIKEPHFYSTDLANRKITSEGAYRRLFRAAGQQHIAIGEASTWYLYSEAALMAIRARHPGARIIVMTRDPVEMFRSLHHHNLRVLHEDEADPERAWDIQRDRASGTYIPRDCVEPKFLQYQWVCSLDLHVARLRDIFPDDRILHITLEDLQHDTVGTYQRVQTFLALQSDGRVQFPVANQARGYRSRYVQRFIRFGGHVKRMLGVQRGFGLARWNEESHLKVPLSESFYARLRRELGNNLSLPHEPKPTLGRDVHS